MLSDMQLKKKNQSSLLIEIRHEYPRKQFCSPMLMMIRFLRFSYWGLDLLLVSRIWLILRVWRIADRCGALVIVACMRSVGLREGGCVVVYITVAGEVRYIVGLASVGMCMRRDKTIRRKRHLLR